MIRCALALLLSAPGAALAQQPGTRQPQELVGMRTVKVLILGLNGFLGDRPQFPFDAAAVYAELDQATQVQLRTAGLEIVPLAERHGEAIPQWMVWIRTTELDRLTNAPALKGRWLTDVRCELSARARLEPPLAGYVTAPLLRTESLGSQNAADVRGSIVRGAQFCTEDLVRAWKWVNDRP